MTDYTVPFRPMPAQSVETPTETPAEIQNGFAHAIEQMSLAIDSCTTLSEAMVMWKWVRGLEQSLTLLSNQAAAKADSLEQ